MLPLSTPTDLADRIACILGGLCRTVANHRDRAASPLILLLWAYLRRKAIRLATLLARFRAGTLRPPRARHPAPRATGAVAAADPVGQPDRPRPLCLPRGAAWLIRRIPATPVYGSQLQALLADSEMVAFLEAAPQARRLLRPLCRALAIPLPEILRLPSRPKAPAGRGAAPRRRRHRRTAVTVTAPPRWVFETPARAPAARPPPKRG